MSFIRLLLFGFLALSVVYLSISVYSRSVRREKLEDAWAEDNPASTDMAARDTYVAEGIKAYNTSFRPKLIGLVYIVPTVVVIAIVYYTNAN
tara:strand:- start:10054 stop:10329 length:276 start_codon:yes stop_codon:yes gene_type:complete